MNGLTECMTSVGLFDSLSEQMQEGISHRWMLLLLMDISGIHYSGRCWVGYWWARDEGGGGGGGGLEQKSEQRAKHPARCLVQAEKYVDVLNGR